MSGIMLFALGVFAGSLMCLIIVALVMGGGGDPS